MTLDATVPTVGLLLHKKDFDPEKILQQTSFASFAPDIWCGASGTLIALALHALQNGIDGACG